MSAMNPSDESKERSKILVFTFLTDDSLIVPSRRIVLIKPSDVHESIHFHCN